MRTIEPVPYTIMLQIERDSVPASHASKESIVAVKHKSRRRLIGGGLFGPFASCPVRDRERRCESCGMVQEECLCVEFTLGG